MTDGLTNFATIESGCWSNYGRWVSFDDGEVISFSGAPGACGLHGN